MSANPAEFNQTVIANFPAGAGEETRVLSYMNSAESIGTSTAFGTADAGPNAMIYPVYGEVTGIYECVNPEASRQWLTSQRGVYKERWTEGGPEWRGGGSDWRSRIHTAGNYLVSIAEDIADIPAALHDLRRTTPHPEHVPEVTDELLGYMNRYYQMQNYGVPRFVLAAFALEPHLVDDKNPITLQYRQPAAFDDWGIFPGLDYHGHGPFMPFVERDHRLLLATHELNEIFQPLMKPTQGTRPGEFHAAPMQFPIEIADTRKGGNQAKPKLAPNNDYFIDTVGLHEGLRTLQAEFADIANGTDTDYDKQLEIGKAVTRAFPSGLFAYAKDQAAISTEAYINAHLQSQSSTPALQTGNW